MKSFKQLRKVNETAGEWGTPELTKKYKDETPGQIKEASVEDHESSMVFHHQKAQDAKKRGDNDAFEKHMDLKHQHAIARDQLNARKKKREAQANLNKQDEEVKEPTGDLKNACWKGYTAVGTKQKDGRTVPNCVPKESVSEAAAPRHIVGVTLSDPSHGMASKRKETIARRVKVTAPDPKTALEKAKKHYSKLGYKVHDAFHHSTIQEGVKLTEAYDDDEEEGNMSRYLLEDIAMMATELSENMEDDDQLEAWVQDKITRSHQYLDDVFSYAESQDGELDMEDDDTPEDEDEMDYPEMNEEVEKDGEVDPRTKKRLETLVRLGLMEMSDLPTLRRAMKKLESDQNITVTAERKVLFDLVETLVGIVTGDDSIFQKVRSNVTRQS